MFLWLAGCVSSPIADRYDDEDHAWLRHVVVSDSRGKFDHHLLPPGYRCLEEKGRGEIEACHLDEVFAGLAEHVIETAEPKLLIFIHGGLNAPHAALRRVEKDHEKIMAAGYYPIFLNWQTGGINAYFDQIYNIRQGERVEQGPFALIAAQRAMTPVFLATDIAETVVTTPVTWIDQGTRLVSRVFEEFEPGDRLYDGQSWDQITHRNNLIVDSSDDEALGQLFEFGRFVLTAPFKLVTTPLIDTFGETAWNNMRRSSRAVFRQHLDFDKKHVPLDCPEDPDCRTGRGAFAQFFERLNALAGTPGYEIERGVPPRALELSIVAHSMGTIVANDAVRDFDLQYDNLVYLAAASSIHHFYETVVPLLQAQHIGGAERKTRFYNLMLHPDAESHEQNYWGLLPRGSLLEWIDGMYEESDSTFDRTLGNWNNVQLAKAMLPAGAQSQMIFKVFPLKDGYPAKHGDFTNEFEDEAGEASYNYWEARFWGSDALAASAR
ncbi:MAG: hypothetical protein AAGA21_03775 [Pseudomonadota bacterium]